MKPSDMHSEGSDLPYLGDSACVLWHFFLWGAVEGSRFNHILGLVRGWRKVERPIYEQNWSSRPPGPGGPCVLWHFFAEDPACVLWHFFVHRISTFTSQTWKIRVQIYKICFQYGRFVENAYPPEGNSPHSFGSGFNPVAGVAGQKPGWPDF